MTWLIPQKTNTSSCIDLVECGRFGVGEMGCYAWWAGRSWHGFGVWNNLELWTWMFNHSKNCAQHFQHTPSQNLLRCVFWPVKGCFARPLPVKIIFGGLFNILTFLSSCRIHVTSFLSIPSLNKIEYWSQKHIQSGNIHFINKMSMLQAWAH